MNCTNKDKDSIIVLSGGVDSVTLLYDEQERIALSISFNYGSKHNHKELPYAKLHAERLGIEHLEIPLAFMGQYFQSDLLMGQTEIPHGSYAQENIEKTVVPFRNGIMLAIAAGMAESRKLKRILIASHFGDHALYPDCRAAFVEPMKAAIAAGTFDGVELAAPYTQLSKGEIVKRGKALGIDYSSTWSCYEGDEIQCGLCATCLERREAMQEAGVEDQTPYKNQG